MELQKRNYNGEYDSCPKCGKPKTKRSKLCIKCTPPTKYWLGKKHKIPSLNGNKNAIGHIPSNKGKGFAPRGEYNRTLRKVSLETLGGKCVQCGFTDFRALQIDHINGNGTKDRKTLRGARFLTNVVRSFLNKENKYQLLCANCNWIKRYENKEHRSK